MCFRRSRVPAASLLGGGAEPCSAKLHACRFTSGTGSSGTHNFSVLDAQPTVDRMPSVAEAEEGGARRLVFGVSRLRRDPRRPISCPRILFLFLAPRDFGGTCTYCSWRLSSPIRAMRRWDAESLQGRHGRHIYIDYICTQLGIQTAYSVHLTASRGTYILARLLQLACRMNQAHRRPVPKFHMYGVDSRPQGLTCASGSTTPLSGGTRTPLALSNYGSAQC